ncbi:UNVERIFIED_CONTAM: Cation/H(+) antiporter 20 [Sesamum radiatum]|uniref:Cation/H(+) antiporter 20 n=1 Tax=Sesamum radiatum TaxID=300843 RepID=A0AAW2LDM8_SESRA
MQVNITSIRTSSNGVWQGDNPLDYAFPLLIIQTTLILILCRLLAFLMKPLRQPKVVAEMMSGILLGPSAFGRNEEYMRRIFPKWSTPILESLATVGLLFFLFLVGLELDLNSIRRGGRRAFAIALAGISLTFVFGIGVTSVFRQAVDGAGKVSYTQYLVFMGVALSITAFPVLARVLAELKLLTTHVGETAMAAAAFNDVAAWISLALAVALAGNGGDGPKRSPLISIWVLLSGVLFVAFMMVAIKPAMKWVDRRCSSEHDTGDEAYISLTLAGVLVAGFATDLIGIHAIFGAFIFGLIIPKGGDFARRLTERIEDFVSGLLLPLYFALSGLKTNVAAIKGGGAWGLLVMVITAACAGKIIGTFAVAMMCMIPARESITLGVLMNTKGLVELIVLNIGKDKKVLNDEAFTILVLMALFTTFLTTPVVMAIYKPARSAAAAVHAHLQSISGGSSDELRVLACVHGPSNIPSSVLNLIRLTRSTNKSSCLKLYVMNLLELTERSSSIIMVQRLRKNGFPLISRLRRDGQLHDQVALAFKECGQMGRVSVRPATAISALASMHEDICHVAEKKMVAMILLPFHKRWRKMNGEDEEESLGQGWRWVNQRVFREAPCSVAVLVDRGYGNEGQKTAAPAPTGGQNVCVIFFGGADDREALELGSRMAEHPGLKVALIRFREKYRLEVEGVVLNPSLGKSRGTSYSPATEEEHDEGALAEFRRRWEGKVEFIEKSAVNILDQVLAIGTSGEYELIVVGNGRRPSTMVAALADHAIEHPELGPVGEVLAASGRGIASSVLVVQQQHVSEGLPVSKISQPEDDINGRQEQISSAVDHRKSRAEWFGSASTAEQVTQGIDAANLTAIITGGASGIGLETARVLALRNAHVIIAARNTETANNTKQLILKDNHNARVDVLKLNLASLKSVKAFADNFIALDLPLNILINNAGIMFCPYELSEDGIEMQFATNHLGHFYLANLLLEKMKDTANSTGIDGRIINLSSVAHLHTYEEGIRFEHINGTAGILKICTFILWKNVHQGAATTCYVALHPSLKGVSGKYFVDCNEFKPSRFARSQVLAKRLWDFSCKLVDAAEKA